MPCRSACLPTPPRTQSLCAPPCTPLALGPAGRPHLCSLRPLPSHHHRAGRPRGHAAQDARRCGGCVGEAPAWLGVHPSSLASAPGRWLRAWRGERTRGQTWPLDCRWLRPVLQRSALVPPAYLPARLSDHRSACCGDTLGLHCRWQLWRCSRCCHARLTQQRAEWSRSRGSTQVRSRCSSPARLHAYSVRTRARSSSIAPCHACRERCCSQRPARPAPAEGCP